MTNGAVACPGKNSRERPQGDSPSRFPFRERFRRSLECFDWERFAGLCDPWLRKSCIGVLLVASVYFLPIAVRVFLK